MRRCMFVVAEARLAPNFNAKAVLRYHSPICHVLDVVKYQIFLPNRSMIQIVDRQFMLKYHFILQNVEPHHV